MSKHRATIEAPAVPASDEAFLDATSSVALDTTEQRVGPVPEQTGGKVEIEKVSQMNPGRLAEYETKFLGVMQKIRKIVGHTTKTLIADAIDYLSVVCTEYQKLGAKVMNDHVSELLSTEISDGDEQEVSRMTWQGRTVFTKHSAPGMSRQLAQVYRRLALAQAGIFDPDKDVYPGSPVDEFGPDVLPLKLSPDTPEDVRKAAEEAHAIAVEARVEREKAVLASEPHVAAVVRWKREGIVTVQDRTGKGDYRKPCDALRGGRTLQSTFTAWQKVTRPKVLVLESLDAQLEMVSFEAADGTAVTLRAEVEDQTTGNKRMGSVRVKVAGRREAVSGYIQGLLVAAIGEGSIKLAEIEQLFKGIQTKVENNYRQETAPAPEGEV